MNMPGLVLEQALLASRRQARAGLICFINAGDPSLDVSLELLRVLAQHQAAAVELCVPFPNSITDGPVLRASHQRALANGVGLPQTLQLAARARAELGLAVVLLADYSHTVEPLGLAQFLTNCRSAGVAATLIHALPAAYRQAYIDQSALLGLGRIMSFFINSAEHVRQAAYQQAQGFIYVVSQFGRTGQRTGFDTALHARLTAIRAETGKPLAVGFGVSTAADITTLRSTGIDALIIGSAATAAVQEQSGVPARIVPAFNALIARLTAACATPAGAQQDHPAGPPGTEN